MNQHTYEIPLNTEYAKIDMKNKSKKSSRFVILAFILGAVSLITCASALVAGILLASNLQSKITELERQNKALESTIIELSGSFNNSQESVLNG